MKGFSDSKRLLILKKSGGRCWYCGCMLEFQTGKGCKSEFCVDHFVPVSSGGSNAVSNLVPCCRTCNTQKKHKSFEAFKRWKTWLGIGEFTEPQAQWLKSHGIEIPSPPVHVFWFESQGLSI